MANSLATPPSPSRKRLFSAARISIFSVLVAALALCLALLWVTRGAMANFSFLNNRNKGVLSSLVNTSPWQTAQALAALAVSAEEQQLAHEAEHLADHAVDQAFAAALRQAHLDTQHRALSGDALALQQRINQLEQLRQQDQAQVDRLSAKTPPGKNAAPSSSGDQLQVAKAQLGLDNDELNDAQRDLQRASGDLSARIQDELAAHEESMRKYDSEVADGQLAILSVSSNRTLAARIGAWLKQRQRAGLIDQARQQSLNDVRTITALHDALEARLNAVAGTAGAGSGASSSAQIASLQNRSAEREILSIDDDRIQTNQQLADVYAKWSAQIQVQHQLAVTGKAAADVAVLLGGQELRIHRIERDEALIARLVELERQFWRYVETDTPPPADGSDSADAALRCLYPEDHGQSVDFTGDSKLSATFSDWMAVREVIAANEAMESKLKQTLQQAMGDATKALFETGSVTWKKAKDSLGLDVARLLKDQPGLAQQYPLPKPGSRRFIVG